MSGCEETLYGREVYKIMSVLDKMNNLFMYKKDQEVFRKRKFNCSIAIKKACGTIAMKIKKVKTRCDVYTGNC